MTKKNAEELMLTKKNEQPLTLAEINQCATMLGAFFSRLRATVAQAERAHDIEARLERAAQMLAPNGAANGTNPSVRRPVPISPAAIIRAVRDAGESGATASEIADALKVDVKRLRPVLWQTRDEGKVRASGKLTTTRYHLPAPRPPKAPATRTTASKKEAAPKKSTNEAPVGNKVKPSKKSEAPKKSAANKAARTAASATDKTASPS